MTNHTPGPWVVHYETIERGGNKGQRRVAGIYHPTPGQKYGADDVVSPRYSTYEGDVWQTWLNCTEANAKLIAAAPQLAEALRAIASTKPGEFAFPSDWSEQVAACPECRRYRTHPIQQGICDEHRRPLWAREKHDLDERAALGGRMRAIAEAALKAAGIEP